VKKAVLSTAFFYWQVCKKQKAVSGGLFMASGIVFLFFTKQYLLLHTPEKAPAV